VELKYLSLVEKKIPLVGCLAFSFIGQGKDSGYKGERGKKAERNDKVDSPGAAPSFPRGAVLRSCRRQWRRVHAVVMSASGATGEHHCFGHDSLVRHWCYRRAPSLDRAARSVPVIRYDQLISLYGVARGSSHTVPVRLALLEIWVHRYSLWQPLTTSRL
jgi:hypothetical protein